MKKTLLTFSIILGLGLVACSGEKASKEEKVEQTEEKVEIPAEEEEAPEGYEEENHQFIYELGLIKDFLNAEFKRNRTAEFIDSGEYGPNIKDFLFEKIDLNGDGEPEYLVYLSGSFFCGTSGCVVMVINSSLDKTLSEFNGMNLPFYVSDKTTNGWRNVVTTSKGKWVSLYAKSNGKYQETPDFVDTYVDEPIDGENGTKVFKDGDNTTFFSFE